MSREAQSLPRVAIESTADLDFLKANIWRALTDKLQMHLPVLAPEDKSTAEDSLRLQVEKLLMEFHKNMFASATSNISINGVDANKALKSNKEPEVYEPFDTALNAKVQSTFAEIERSTVDVANLRRTVPRQVSQMYLHEQSSLNSESDVLAEPLDLNLADTQAQTQLPREDELSESYQRAIADLSVLKKDIPATVAKVERANASVERFSGTKPS